MINYARFLKIDPESALETNQQKVHQTVSISGKKSQ